MSQIRSVYRRLLRELPTNPTTATRTAHQKLSAASPLQKRLRETLSSSKADSAHKIALAEQFVHYVQAQRMYATLIERYNPGMGMSEEERVRLTARKVGMDLPKEFRRES